jgi:AcrR family transcriptional regulator
MERILPMARTKAPQRRTSTSASKIRSKSGRPTKDEADRRIAHLLDVATHEFAELGYRLASLESIARKVGMAKRTLYSRFPDKTALFLAVCQRMNKRIALSEITNLPNASIETGLHQVIRAILDFVYQPDGLALIKLLQKEGPSFPELIEINHKLYQHNVLNPLIAFWTNQKSKGVLRDIDPAKAASFVTTYIQGELSGRLLQGISAPSPTERDATAKVVSDFLLNGIKIR